MMLSLAQFELERIRESWHIAEKAAIGRGIHIASHAPTGYFWEKDKFGKVGKLQVDPVFAPLVVNIFEMRAAGKPWSTIRDHLNSIHPGPLGGAWASAPSSGSARTPSTWGKPARATSTSTALIPHSSMRSLGRRCRSSVRHGGGSRRLRCAGSLAARRAVMSCREDVQAHKKASWCGRGTARHYNYSDCPAPASIRGVSPNGGGLGVVEMMMFDRLKTIEFEAGDSTLEALDARVQEAAAALSAYLDDKELEDVVGRKAFLEQARSRREIFDEAVKELDGARRSSNFGWLDPGCRA